MVQGPVDTDLEQLLAEPGDGQVAADAAGLVERQGVGDRPDRLVQLAGSHPLEQAKRTGAGDLKRG